MIRIIIFISYHADNNTALEELTKGDHIALGYTGPLYPNHTAIFCTINYGLHWTALPQFYNYILTTRMHYPNQYILKILHWGSLDPFTSIILTYSRNTTLGYSGLHYSNNIGILSKYYTGVHWTPLPQ